MMRVHQAISSVFGIGYIGKGAGSLAAAVCAILWWLISGGVQHWPLALVITILICAIGVLSANVVEKTWGKDHQRVVIDEVAGMCVSLLWIAPTPIHILLCWLLFRFFDIVKPLFIKKMEGLPGGWGVMADDLLAGIYANIIMQLVIAFKLV